MIDLRLEIITVLVYAAVYLAVFLLGEAVNRFLPSRPELSRKAVHLLGGLVALSFPQFVHSHWTVFVLCLSTFAIMLVTRRKKMLQSVHGIDRASHGGLYYPAAIYLVFYFAAGQPVVYFVSILVMSVSDALAALLGGKYGAIKFDVEGGLKTLEGSTVFFFVTFLCVHLPLLLGTDIGRAESVLIAGIIALLITGFEAISLSGSDNIIVPLGTYFVLTKMMRFGLPVLLSEARTLGLIISFTALLMLKPRLLKPSGLIAMMLLNYGAIALCNFYWFLPLVLAQIMYYILIRIFVHYEGNEKVESFQVKVIFYLGIIPTALIFIANRTPSHTDVYLPYLASITAQMAIIAHYFFNQYLGKPFGAQEFLKKHRKVIEISSAFAATLFVTALPVYLQRVMFGWRSVAMVMAGAWTAYVLNFMMNQYYRGVKDDIFEYRRRLVAAALGVAIVFVLQRFISL